MNTAEIKLELFRKIDSLTEPDLEKVYKKMLALLNSTSSYNLSPSEKKAIDEALHSNNKANKISHPEVIKEAMQKYPNLKFK